MGSIRIDLQKRVYAPGEEISGTMYVFLDKAVSQRGVMASLVGKERTEVPYTTTVHTGNKPTTQNQTAVQESNLLNQQFPVSLPTDEKGKIGPGNYNVPFKFTLPQGLPATYRGRHARILYNVTAKIDVPLWVDVTGLSEFEVVGYGVRTPQSAPINACSNSWGNLQSGGISFTLERCEYARGEIVNGKCDFRNPGSKDLRKIDVALRWIETATAQGHVATIEIMNQVTQVPIQSKMFQGQSPFSIRIPENAPPTYESSLSSVRCILTANLDVAWAGDVTARQNIRIVGIAGDQRVIAPQYPQQMYQPPQQTYQPPQQMPQPQYQDRAAANEYCTQCGKSVSATATYCPHCGAKMPAPRK